MSVILIVILAIATLVFALVAIYVKKKNILIWMGAYIRGVVGSGSNNDKPIDIMFLFVDHFELNGDPRRLQAWNEEFPALAKGHKDWDGQHPKHSFFYAMDLMHEHELEQLQHLVADGFGEFELHWHHAHDNAETFELKLQAAMKIFHQYGYMKPYKSGQQACFGFIHGDWSLGNARGIEFCGVDNEIELLMKNGCYADFTFPALFNKAQPPIINSIYYARENHRAKSYFKGRHAQVGARQEYDEFMIFQGPLTINWSDWRHKWHPTIEDGDVNRFPTHDDPKRIDAWIRQNIHVEGQANWRFVKIFCHGAQDHQSVVSDATDRMFSYLESRYNDGSNYRLHYVTAREAYNIVKAAEDGKKGNPNQYRDYVIPHPLNR